MSADNINRYTVEGYNFYTVVNEGKTYVIGGVPEELSENYIEITASADAVIILTSKPEFTGGLEKALDRNPNLIIYGGSAALRNIKELLNRTINEQLIKDNMQEGSLEFFVTPNLHWVDTIMVKCGRVLFSGECFSGFDGTAVGLKNYYAQRIAVNKGFALSAVERLEKLDITTICPAYGLICPQGKECLSGTADEIFASYRKWILAKKESKRAVVIYSSEYKNTEALAKQVLNTIDAELFDAKTSSTEAIVEAVNNADMLAIGTCTINRNVPQEIWDVITRLDMINSRGMSYFVFGSFGWAGDAIRLVDKTLELMGMRRVAKPVDVLFRPTEKDFQRIDKAAEKMLEYSSDNNTRK